MTLTLYTYAANFRAIKCLVVAEYNGIAIDVPEFEMMKDNVTPEFLAKSPLGKVPVLETPEGSIFESNAIARYIARMRRDTDLYGKNFFDSGVVDSWVDFSAHELELPCIMWLYPVLGYMPFNPAASAKAKEDVKAALKVLDSYLMTNTFLVGDNITLADITVASTLLYPMKFLMDKAFRGPFGNLTRWFTTVVNQEAFKKVAGEVVLCAKTMLAEGEVAPAPAPKKEKKKAAAPAPAPKKKEEKKEEPPKPKKKTHPLLELPKSSMSLDEMKTNFSNPRFIKPDATYYDTMDKFWEMFDSEGYCICEGQYNYNEDNKIVFMVCNEAEGFVQRADSMRKFAFGSVVVHGEAGKLLKISTMWLFRGDSEKYMIEACDDAECYTWKKVAGQDVVPDAAMKQRIADMWCAEETLDGLPIQFKKVFK